MSLDVTISSIIVSATFFLLPALGEIITERSGILNLGIEGMMISGAASSFAVAYTTGSLLLGLMAGVLIGGGLALIHAVVTITFNRNQVVSGISLTIFGTGLSGLLGLGFAGLPLVPLPSIADHLGMPSLVDIPFFGVVFFTKNKALDNIFLYNQCLFKQGNILLMSIQFSDMK